MNEVGPHLRAAPPGKSAALAVLLGWIVPGLGQAYAGRAGKGLFFFAVVVGAYVLGLALADWRCVSYERHEVWFFAQALAAAPTAVAAWATRPLEVTQAIPLLDVGLLYTSIAGLLNAVAVSDAIGSVEEVALERRAARERDEAEMEVLEPGPVVLGPPAAPSAPVADLEVGTVGDADAPPAPAPASWIEQTPEAETATDAAAAPPEPAWPPAPGPATGEPTSGPGEERP